MFFIFSCDGKKISLYGYFISFNVVLFKAYIYHFKYAKISQKCPLKNEVFYTKVNIDTNFIGPFKDQVHYLYKTRNEPTGKWKIVCVDESWR